MKLSRHKNREIPSGVQKHKINAYASDAGLSLIDRKISIKNLTRVHGLAEFCRIYLATVCSKLCLIPLQPSATRQSGFEASSVWKQIVHYLIVIAELTLFGHKITVIIHMLINEKILMREFK